MLGSSAFRMSVTPGGALAGPWVKNPLWRTARAVPSLDLPFADTKSLTDAVTGQSLVTFTRASSGTSVGSDGVLRTATTNLLLRSEEFDNASWVKLNITAASNQTTAPDGSANADLIAGNAGTAVKYIYQNSSASTSGTFTFSVFAKAGTESFIVVRITDQGGVNEVRQRFDLSSGVLSGSVAVNGTATAASSSINPVGNGWHRCVVTATFAAFTLLQGNVFLNSYAAVSLTTNFYLWGAQLEQSSTVGEYIPTTSTINSAPRFDHNPTTGESLGLLVEEQRTNLLLQSADFATTWVTQNGYSVVSNQAASPDGSLTADAASRTNASTQYLYQNVSASGTLTFSCWVRTASGTGTFRLSSYNATDGTKDTGDLTATTTWQRFSLTVTQSGATTGWYPCNGAINTTFYIWGAQLEVGSFPTSYIPTTTAAATRSADVPSNTGTAFSSWYRQDEGTVFAEGATVLPSTGITHRPLCYFGNSAATDRWEQRYMSIGVGSRVYVNDDGATQADFSFSTPSAGQVIRIASAIALNNFAASVNGSSVQTDASGTVPTNDRLEIATSVNQANYFNGTIRRLTYWPQRLPNSTIQALTQ